MVQIIFYMNTTNLKPNKKAQLQALQELKLGLSRLKTVLIKTNQIGQ